MKRLNVLVLGTIASITVLIALAGYFIESPTAAPVQASQPQTGLDTPF